MQEISVLHIENWEYLTPIKCYKVQYSIYQGSNIIKSKMILILSQDVIKLHEDAGQGMLHRLQEAAYSALNMDLLNESENKLLNASVKIANIYIHVNCLLDILTNSDYVGKDRIGLSHKLIVENFGYKNKSVSTLDEKI